MRVALSVLFLVAVFAGCARHTSGDGSASPKYKDRVSCEAAGGKWKPLFHHCDMD
jgi:hypothetical protein